MNDLNRTELSGNKRSLLDYAVLTLSGIAIGIANVIPGVSGGTMAFLLGIYEELIDAIRRVASLETLRDLFTFRIKKLLASLPWKFLLALCAGIFIALGSCAKLFTYLLTEYPAMTFAFFFGLVAASVIAVLKKVKQWSLSRLIVFILGGVTALLIVTLVPVSTPNVWWLSFAAGVIVICAMILPGISGSFLLLIMGQFKYVWGSVAILAALGKGVAAGELCNAVKTVFFLGAGCIVGLGSFVHLLNYLFKRFHDLTVAALIGFMVGSLWKLWPWKEVLEYSVSTKTAVLTVKAAAIAKYQQAGNQLKVLVDRNVLPAVWDSTVWLTIALAAAGFILVAALEYFAVRRGR
ncbi:MAG: DUF368 domain-containing protein [Victivallaceae bacterium]|nr:DUF368 domain-containing protein [Victivallaceae bacterium]